MFLSTGAATAPVGESMGLGSMGSRPPGGDQATGAQIVEVSPNGKATVVWQDAQPLRGGGVDGRNLLVCAKDGLLRLPGHGKPPVHIADTCRGVHLWRDWQLDWEVGLFAGEPLVARSLASPARVVTMHPKVFGLAGAILSDDAAAYVCVTTKTPRTCNLVRLPGPIRR